MRLSMAGTSTSMVYLLMFAGCPSTAEVRIHIFSVTYILPAPFVNSVSNDVRFDVETHHVFISCLASFVSSDEGSVQVVLQGGRQHGLLSAQGQGH